MLPLFSDKVFSLLLPSKRENAGAEQKVDWRAMDHWGFSDDPNLLLYGTSSDGHLNDAVYRGTQDVALEGSGPALAAHPRSTTRASWLFPAETELVGATLVDEIALALALAFQGKRSRDAARNNK